MKLDRTRGAGHIRLDVGGNARIVDHHVAFVGARRRFLQRAITVCLAPARLMRSTLLTVHRGNPRSLLMQLCGFPGSSPHWAARSSQALAARRIEGINPWFLAAGKSFNILATVTWCIALGMLSRAVLKGKTVCLETSSAEVN